MARVQLSATAEILLESRTPEKKTLIAATGVMLLFSAPIFGVAALLDCVNTTGWQAAPATLESRDMINERRHGYVPSPVSAWLPQDELPALVVKYRYMVGAATFLGSTKVTQANGLTPAWREDLKVGDKFEILFDPNEPSETVLSRVQTPTKPRIPNVARAVLLLLAMWASVGVLTLVVRR